MVCFVLVSVLASNLNMFTTHKPDIVQDREPDEDTPALSSSLIILNMDEMNTGHTILRLPSGCISSQEQNA